MDSNQILGLVIFVLILIFAVPWTIFFMKRYWKIIKILSNQNKLQIIDAYLLPLKLTFNLYSFPKEIQNLYRPIRKAGFIVLAILITIIVVMIILVILRL